MPQPVPQNLQVPFIHLSTSISSSAKADFANGLFLTAANLGTTFGTILGGFFISRLGTNYVVFAGLLFIVLAGVVVWWQVRELACEKEDNELGFEKSV